MRRIRTRPHLLLYRPAALVATLLAAASVQACSGRADAGPASVAVQRGSVVTSVSADGAVESAQELALNFEAMGRIAAVTVDEGQRVRRGQVLARLENGAQRDRLGSALANLDAARASLAATRDGLTAVEMEGQARLADQASVDVSGAQRDLADVRSSSRANLFGLRRALARAQVTGEVADLRAAELRLAQEQSRVDVLRDRYERLRALSDRDREQLQHQLDRRRDAQNQIPPDTFEINDAAYRIAVLTSKIEDEEADELGAREEYNTAVANVRVYVQDVDRNRISLREARRRLGDASDTLRNGIADARRQVDTAARSWRPARRSSASSCHATASRRRSRRLTWRARSPRLARGRRRPPTPAPPWRTPSCGPPPTASWAASKPRWERSWPARWGCRGWRAGGSPSPLPPADGSPAVTPATGASAASPTPPPGPGAVAPSPQGLITLTQTRGLQVKAAFDETDAASLRTGDPARVTIDAIPGRSWPRAWPPSIPSRPFSARW